MTRRGAWEPLAAVVALLVLGGAVTWYTLEDLVPSKIPVPGISGSSFHALAANMPEIAKFEAFYSNNDNPFVPWRTREVEARRAEQGKMVAIKPHAPPVITVTKPPVLSLPPKAAGGGDAPKVFGFQGKGPTSTAIVQIPGETKPRTMLPGEKAGRWTFVAIESGNIAKFTDDTGRPYAVMIGGKK